MTIGKDSRLQSYPNMNSTKLTNYRIGLTAIFSIAVWATLAWDYFHDGIPAHHLFANPGLPKVSNGWGGILLPVLAGYLLYRIQYRATTDGQVNATFVKTSLIRLVISILYSLSIALAFTFGYSAVSDYLFFGIFILALFLPLYRPEFYLGFVVGLCFFFGGVLPVLIGSVVVLLSALLHAGIYPVVRRVVKRA